MYSNSSYAGGPYQSSSHRGYSNIGYSSGPPPGSDPQLWQWFTAVDTDRSGSISVAELQSALVNGPSFPVSSLDVGLTDFCMTQETGQVSFQKQVNQRSSLSRPLEGRSVFLCAYCICWCSWTHRAVGFDLDTVKMLMNIFVSRPVVQINNNAILNVYRTPIEVEP
jgi:hypothetical protein